VNPSTPPPLTLFLFLANILLFTLHFSYVYDFVQTNVLITRLSFLLIPDMRSRQQIDFIPPVGGFGTADSVNLDPAFSIRCDTAQISTSPTSPVGYPCLASEFGYRGQGNMGKDSGRSTSKRPGSNLKTGNLYFVRLDLTPFSAHPHPFRVSLPPSANAHRSTRDRPPHIAPHTASRSPTRLRTFFFYEKTPSLSMPG